MKKIVGLAGHIDHGKTTLIEKLTGKNTYRHKEEKSRNMTIDIGFARYDENITFIDVPGHEKFLKNMLTGISSVNFIVLVIACDDGIMPQTLEHAEIINALGFKEGLIVLTKSDLVDMASIIKLKADIRRIFQNTTLSNFSMIEISNENESSIFNLKKILEDRLSKLKDDSFNYPYFRLDIDRFFTIKGFGNVITGTSKYKNLNIESKIYLYPQVKNIKIKALEEHGIKKITVTKNSRVAINIGKIDSEKVKRGDIISTIPYIQSTSNLFCRFIPSFIKKDFNVNRKYKLHIGTQEVSCRIKKILHNGVDYFYLRLEKAIFCDIFNKGILHSSYSNSILGSIEILDIDKNKSDFSTSYLDSLLKRLLFIRELNLSSTSQEESLPFSVYQLHLLVEKLNSFHNSYPLRKGISEKDLFALVDLKMKQKDFSSMISHLLNTGVINKLDKFISLSSFKIKLTKIDKMIKEDIFKQYKENKYSLKSKSSLRNEFENLLLFDEVHNYMEENNFFEHIAKDYYILKGYFKEAQKKLLDYVSEYGKIEVSEFKKLLGNDRNSCLLLFEKFDKILFTKRIKYYRIIGGKNDS